MSIFIFVLLFACSAAGEQLEDDYPDVLDMFLDEMDEMDEMDDQDVVIEIDEDAPNDEVAVKKDYIIHPTGEEGGNECAQGTHECDAAADCIQAAGSYTCQCKVGYKGDGWACSKAHDACAINGHLCPLHSSCRSTNTWRGFTCVCKSGYHMNGDKCQAKDACASNRHLCPAQSTCRNTNTWRGYTCLCKSGYHLNGAKCQDVNECLTRSIKCPANAKCVNTNGGYTCQCGRGFKSKGRVCTADYHCDWLPGNGEGYTSRWIGYITPKACIVHCTKTMNSGGNVNGATIYSSHSPGCWCVQKMTHVSKSSSYKTCYLKPIKQETYTCNYQTGDGKGSGNYWIGKFRGPECMKHCAERRNTGIDTRVNGATARTNGSPECWCEYGMTYVYSGATSWKTCYLKPVQG